MSPAILGRAPCPTKAVNLIAAREGQRPTSSTSPPGGLTAPPPEPCVSRRRPPRALRERGRRGTSGRGPSGLWRAFGVPGQRPLPRQETHQNGRLPRKWAREWGQTPAPRAAGWDALPRGSRASGGSGPGVRAGVDPDSTRHSEPPSPAHTWAPPGAGRAGSQWGGEGRAHKKWPMNVGAGGRGAPRNQWRRIGLGARAAGQWSGGPGRSRCAAAGRLRPRRAL